jgi:hypothetical protein
MIARRELFSFLAVAPLAAVVKPPEPKVDLVLPPGAIGTFVQIFNAGDRPITVHPDAGMVVVR